MKKFKKITLFLLLMIMSINLFAFKSNAEDVGYYIKNMNVNVDVNDKREFKITETIDVYFTEDRHGIIRNIPTSTQLEDYKITDVSVEGEPYEVEDTYEKSIKIGDADKTISGDKTYKITYTIKNYGDERSEGDYIYLNVLGTEWDTNVEKFTSTITYPKEAILEKINVTVGEYGSEESKNVKYKVKGNKIYINSTKNMDAYNGITVNAMLNEGAFKNAPIKKYPYTITNELININITDEKQYEIQRNFQIKINKDYKKENLLEINLYDLVKDVNFYLLDMTMDDKNISYDKGSGIIKLGNKTDEYNFTVNYILEPRMSDNIVFEVVSPNLDGKIENLKVKINSPFPINSTNVDFNERGTNLGTDRFDLKENGNNVAFTNKNTISVGESINLHLDIESNLFSRPLPPSANIFNFGVLVLLVLIVFLYFKFRDNNPLTPVVNFYPPRNMNSAEVAYAFNETIHNTQVTSLLFYWASKGYIKIIMGKDDKFSIKKLKEMNQKEKDYEKILFNSMFKNKEEVTSKKLEKYFPEEVNKAVISIKEEFKGDKKLRDSASKKIGFLLSLLSSIPIVWGMVIAGKVDCSSPFFYGITSLVLVVIHLVFYVIFCFILKKRHGLIRKNKRIMGVIITSIIYFILIIFSFLFTDLNVSLTMMSVLIPLIGNILSSCVPRRSNYGKELLGEIIGFRNFIEVAEKERLEALLEEDPEYFYNTLPYAQVLGVTKKWANKFKDISMVQPSYYDTYYPVNNYVALNMFVNDLNKVNTTASYKPDTSSSSSSGGFGGGGFSGGGSGGGGGSSW